MKKFRRLILFLKKPPFPFLCIVWGITFALIAGTVALIVLNYMSGPFISPTVSARFFPFIRFIRSRALSRK